VRKFHACLDAKSNIVFYLPTSHAVSPLNGPRPSHYRGFTITLRQNTFGSFTITLRQNTFGSFTVTLRQNTFGSFTITLRQNTFGRIPVDE
jgi:hypothetical protein